MDKQSCVSGTEGINPKVLPKSFQRTIIGGATGTGIGILLFFLGILMLLPAPASATATWFGRYVGPWSYSDSYGDHKAIVQTTDGGYATVGAKYYWGFLTKLSATGEVQWSHVVGDDTTYRSTYFSHMAATPDGGVVVAGHTAIGPQLGSDDLLVMKFSSTGTVVWQRVYGAEGLHIRDPLRIYVNDDGTLSVMASFLLGGCNSCGCSEINVYHLKLDGTTGTMLAETMLDSSPHGRKVAGGFVTMVALYNLDISQYTLTLNKFNDSGTNQWSKQYLAVDPDNSTNLIGLGKEDMSITEIPNGYILGGMGYDGEYYIFRIDSTGSVQWMKRFDCYPDSQYGTSLPSSDIVTTTDGAVLISIRNGYSTVENTILKVNTADGSLLWANRYREGGGGQNYFNSLTPLAAGYFAACGYARVAVLDSSGNLAQPCDPLEITPVTAEITHSSVKWEEHNSPGKGYCDLFPALQSAPCDLIDTSAGGFSSTEFCGGDNGGTCDADHFDLCTTKDDCTTAGGYWYDDLCHQSPEETELINNHYIGACGLTDTQSFTLDHDAFVTRINVWYNTRIGGDSLHVVMTEPDSSQKIFDTVKGSCDPYQTWWCEGMISLNQVFAAGTYVLASDSASMCSDPSDKTTLVVYGNKVTNSPPGNAMPLPNGQESPIITAPAAAPVINIDPATANPLGFGTAASGGTTLSLTAGISGLSGPADLYLGISLGTEIYLFDNDNNLHPLSDGMVKWRANTTGGINKRILPDIDMSAFPGTYNFYFFMTPAGRMDAYRLWTMPVVIRGAGGGGGAPSPGTGGGTAGTVAGALLSGLGAMGSGDFSQAASGLVSSIQEGNLDSVVSAIVAKHPEAASMISKTGDGYKVDFGAGHTFSSGTTVSGSMNVALTFHQIGASPNDSSRTTVIGSYRLDLNNVKINGVPVPDNQVHIGLQADVISAGTLEGNMNLEGDAGSRGGVVFDARKGPKYPLAGYMKVGDDIVNFNPDGTYTAGGNDFPTLDSVTPNEIAATGDSAKSTSITLHGKNLWPPYIYDRYANEGGEGGIDADYNYRCQLRTVSGGTISNSFDIDNWTPDSITFDFPKSNEKGTYEIYLDCPWAKPGKTYYDSANKVTFTVR